MSNKVSQHYNDNYFDWQAPHGEFGGWASHGMFKGYISSQDDVLDFGCGGGYLLKMIDCKRKLGVEINPKAAEMARTNGIEVYQSVDDVPDECLDVIISNNALEHTLQPLEELKSLYRKLRPGGRIIFVVPSETILFRYQPNDINHHLYSWSPMCIGNLFAEAGFQVIEAKPYIHKWPPYYRQIAKLGGRPLFEAACRIYGLLTPSWYQVRVVAEKRQNP
jgi:SAM-dependent methyltransferase